MSFESLGLLPELVRALSDKGYTEATAIQSQAIPLIMNGEDVLGGAQTGTGKTAAFTLPVLQRLVEHPNPKHKVAPCVTWSLPANWRCRSTTASVNTANTCASAPRLLRRRQHESADDSPRPRP